MRNRRTIRWEPYAGSTDAEGYPTGDSYGAGEDRDCYGWYPLSSELSPAGEYDRRVITSKVVLVPNPADYSARDHVILPGDEPVDERTYFVSEDVRDYTTGPYPHLAEHGGEVVIEKVTG